MTPTQINALKTAIDAVPINLVEMALPAHAKLTNISRQLEVKGLTINAENREINLFYTIVYKSGSEVVPIQMPLKEWRITATSEVILRDENFAPVTDTANVVVKVNAYKYISYMVRQGANLFTVIAGYAQAEMVDGFFNP